MPTIRSCFQDGITHGTCMWRICFVLLAFPALSVVEAELTEDPEKHEVSPPPPEVPAQQNQSELELPITFALFYIGNATGRNGRRLVLELRHIREHHKSRKRFSIVILTDEKTDFTSLPSALGVELRRQPSESLSQLRYLYRALAERSVLQDALQAGRPTHVVYLDAADIVVTRSFTPMFHEQEGHDFGFALTYRPPVKYKGRVTKGSDKRSVAETMPVNLGVKAVHGWSLQSGLDFFDAFIGTFKRNYLDLNRTYGMNEQLAMMDVLKRSADYSNAKLWRNHRLWWKVPVKDVNGAVTSSSWKAAFGKCQKSTGQSASGKCVGAKVEYARVRMLPGSQWNCLRPFHRPSCANSRVLHFKGGQKSRMIRWTKSKIEERNPLMYEQRKKAATNNLTSVNQQRSNESETGELEGNGLDISDDSHQ
ncbi:hypothetical protein CYMTET_5936 [Cymbomonas tetramitiformis]|uniref:Hexosyltransferase n=1 Tax=Cymbomonas tetramitiformis TaxID=36881 RepID=A0AAE0LIK3_9CHLO|nr:hypothetical protein CYMTET_5936 [Cymbomonas tetramitiformis]